MMEFYWLMEEYFSPKSLIQLASYYQVSRMSYGMCTYIDNGKVMDSLEKMTMKYLRSIINVKDNVKSNLLRVTMNLPKMEYLLYNRLLNVIQKSPYFTFILK